MSEIRNKIITISGEPKAGKSTVVKFLKERYEREGFNVHFVNIGQLFRDHVKKEYAKIYPDRIDANLADIQMDSSFIEIRDKIDQLLDKEIVEKKGIEINSKERPNDIFIIDARLAWKNIPHSFAVRLTIDEKIAGQRAFLDKARGAEDEYHSVEEAIEKTSQRKRVEIERYKEGYNLDLTDPENYNLIVDTSYSNPEELAEIIMEGEVLYRQGRHCTKYWASPAHFLPLQLGRITGRPTDRGNTIESLAEDIIKKGYHMSPDGVLEIIEKEGIKFLLKGNHRVCGALSAGKTLLPYVVTNRDNKLVEDITTRLISSDSYMEYLYDYAEGIQYYGGKIGKLDELIYGKDVEKYKFSKFSKEDLLSYDDVIALMGRLQDDGR